MPTSTFYPSVDGHIGGGSDTSWALARSQTTGEGGANTDSTTDNRPLLGWESNNAGDARTYFIIRGFIGFDTSSLPDNAVITSATLNTYVTQKYSVSAGSACLVSASPASNTTLVDEDFDQVGSTEFATRTLYSGLTTSAYKAWTLNASGLAAISKTGYTHFAFRPAKDLDNSAPSNTQYSGGYISTSEHTGTSQDPYLDVTYSLTATQGLAVAVTEQSVVSQGLAVEVTPRAGYVTRGLRALWCLDESSGTNADESAELAADGTYTGTPTLGGSGPPLTSGSVRFDANDHLSATNQSALRFTGTAAFTLEAWVNLDSQSGTTRAIIQQADVVHPYAGWTFDIDSAGKLLLGRFDNGSPGYTFTTSTTALTAGTWTHVAVTYDGTDVRFYLNGVIDGSPQADSRSITATSTEAIQIGNYITGYGAGDFPLTGSLAWVAVSDVALSAAELLTHVPAVATQGLAVKVYGTATATQGVAVKSGSTWFPRWTRSLLPHASSPSVVASTTPSAWDDYWVYGATVAINSDGTPYQDGSSRYYVYYIGASTARNHGVGQSEDQTGLLTTTDFVTFTRHASNPVLPFGAGTYNDGAWDDTDVQVGKVIVHAGTFYAFYCGNNVAGPGSDFVRLGVATSSDGVTWTKSLSGPMLSQGSSGAADELDLYTAGGVLYDADEADANKRWKWYYIGHSAAGVLRTMLATAPSPTGTWTKQAALTGIDPEGSGGSTYSPGITQVWKQDSVYYAIADDWYNLTASWVYVSTDGAAWTKRTQVLALPGGSVWDRSTAYYPVVFERTAGSRKFTYLYTASNNSGALPVYGIGVAEFMDAGVVSLSVKVAGGTVQGLAVNVAGWVAQGLRVKVAGAFRQAFAVAVGGVSYGTASQGLGVAVWGSQATVTQGLGVRVTTDASMVSSGFGVASLVRCDLSFTTVVDAVVTFDSVESV